MKYECTRCGGSIEASRVDATRQIATCGSCHTLVDLLPQTQRASAPNSPSVPRARMPVTLPAGMEIERKPEALVISRRWLRAKHFGHLAFASGAAASAGYGWAIWGPSIGLVLGTVFVAWYVFMVLAVFCNSTTIIAKPMRVEVRHGPIPTPMYRNQSLAVAELQQLFAAPFGALFEVSAQRRDGTHVSLVRPLVSAEQALFVEQELERQLGIIDVPVEGELPRPDPLAPSIPAPLPTNAAGLLALFPALIMVGVGVLLFFVFSSSVEGTLETSGDRLGEGRFTPSRCNSGQPKGFFGVELRAADRPGVVVRAMRDPTRGVLLAIDGGGPQPVVLSPDDCAALDVEIIQTGTVINKVRSLDGTLSADCPELRGTLSFSTCH